MTIKNVILVDRSQRAIAKATIEERNGLFQGEVDLASMPLDVRQTFDEFEQIVNEAAFGCLDEMEQQITDLGIKAAFDDGSTAEVQDLQIWPSTGGISFRGGAKTVTVPFREANSYSIQPPPSTRSPS